MAAKRIKLKDKKKRTLIVDQWIEIKVIDGVTVTKRYPSDAEVEELIQEREEQTGRVVELIYRRLNFVNGVPSEYFWTTDDLSSVPFGGRCIQRLVPQDWRELIKKEKGGHLTYGDHHMPRPESRGGCDCPACQSMAQRIEQEGR